MYMNLKPNQCKRISFNTTTMTSLVFIAPPASLNLAPPPKKFNFMLRSFHQLFWSEIFRSPLKLGEAATTLNEAGKLVPDCFLFFKKALY